MTVSQIDTCEFPNIRGPSELDDACRAFELVGSPVPSVIWSPKRPQLLNPLIENFDDRCRELGHADGSFYAADLEVEAFGPLKEWLMVLRIDTSQREYVYAHYGQGIAQHFGRDMTGNTTGAFGGHISDFFNAVYNEVARTKSVVLTEHEPPKQVFVCSWRRLLRPLLDRDGIVSGFLAINVPESPLRAGLDIVPEPVLVLDEDQCVRYANAFAIELFDLCPWGINGLSFEKITGARLKAPSTPAQMFSQRIVENSILKLTIGGSLSDCFLITTTGAVHSGRSYYITMIRSLVNSNG